MLIETLKNLFRRDLNRLRDEISLYKQEGNIWLIERDISNSAGNLCLHLIGNLQTYIGAEIGKTGYIRDRAAEFSLKDIPRTRLLDQIDDTIDVVTRSLDLLSEENLFEIYPILVFEEKTTTQYLLVHLTTHLTYHLGQINYHRRLLDQPEV
ncbi:MULTISPECIES: DUF1572 family protein [Sphingobacterium]|uniref:DUF1572 family protein n=1 Tax=Sphingobacterium TaxID=28453 RepID=UPI0008A574A7|nr:MULTISPECIES: DUF1572 family protein [Sphingobacterium]OFV15276.1 DinB superfamily protein [Sphingobacterium sp. HMSC13C05]HAF36616.1 DinB family protein [Sphingobacterium sp.]HAU55160.1 DinB family protein [Sphingobacterium sp.]HCX58663.1 DinB family protein [Sphingobacterium sp.]